MNSFKNDFNYISTFIDNEKEYSFEEISPFLRFRNLIILMKYKKKNNMSIIRYIEKYHEIKIYPGNLSRYLKKNPITKKEGKRVLREYKEMLKPIESDIMNKQNNNSISRIINGVTENKKANTSIVPNQSNAVSIEKKEPVKSIIPENEDKEYTPFWKKETKNKYNFIEQKRQEMRDRIIADDDPAISPELKRLALMEMDDICKITPFEKKSAVLDYRRNFSELEKIVIKDKIKEIK